LNNVKHVAMIGPVYINYRPVSSSSKWQTDHFIRRRNYPVGGKSFDDNNQEWRCRILGEQQHCKRCWSTVIIHQQKRQIHKKLFEPVYVIKQLTPALL
jgi:cytochrome c-type biogenesis protein CcmH/NrfF